MKETGDANQIELHVLEQGPSGQLASRRSSLQLLCLQRVSPYAIGVLQCAMHEVWRTKAKYIEGLTDATFGEKISAPETDGCQDGNAPEKMS